MMKPFRLTGATACKLIVAVFALCVVPGAARGQEKQASQAPAPRGDTSYGPVNMDENLVQLVEKMRSAKPEIEHRQQQLLEQRYDLWARSGTGSLWDPGIHQYKDGVDPVGELEGQGEQNSEQ